jgi:hypothetical protein
VTALLSGYARITLHQKDTQTPHGTINAKCFLLVSRFWPSSGTVCIEGAIKLRVNAQYLMMAKTLKRVENI